MLKLKPIGTVLALVFAVSAVAASSAAANYHLNSAKGGLISGSQVTQNQIATKVGTLKCGFATFSGSMASETESELWLSPSYSSCTLAGVSVTVTTFSCTYKLQKPTTTESAPIKAHAKFELCSSVGNIVVKDNVGLGCELVFPAQSVGIIEFSNEISGSVLISFEVTGIKYSWTKSCPNAGGKAGEASTGTYTGSAKLSSASGIFFVT